LTVPDLRNFGWAGADAAGRGLDLTIPDLRNFGGTKTGRATYNGFRGRYGAGLVRVTGSLNLTVPDLSDLGGRRRTPIRTGKPFAFFLHLAWIFPLAFAARWERNRIHRLANLRTGLPVAWF